MMDEFESLLRQVGDAGNLFRVVFKEVTGEEFDLESAVRHYPVIALALAAGAGAAAGWWAARRNRALPPPQTAPSLPAEPAAPPPNPLTMLEDFFPGAVERVEQVRNALPEIVVSDAMKQRARTWLDDVVQKQIGEDLNTVTNGLSMLGNLFASRRPKNGDVHLPDPSEEPEA